MSFTAINIYTLKEVRAKHSRVSNNLQLTMYNVQLKTVLHGFNNCKLYIIKWLRFFLDNH